MTKKTVSLLPKLERLSQGLGQRIKAARLRRKISATLFAERLGVSRNTLMRLEQGDAAVSLGAYIKALSILGLAQDINTIAGNDTLGRALQDQRDARPAFKCSTQDSKQPNRDVHDVQDHVGTNMSDTIHNKNSTLIAEILSTPITR